MSSIHKVTCAYKDCKFEALMEVVDTPLSNPETFADRLIQTNLLASEKLGRAIDEHTKQVHEV